ncbi:hypothetical protein [Paraburkholderia saeva]|uniref:hypothetical protein n=1 Tax=Paraburkholderia saeva TaxID=2777537 RepID=UPI001DB54D41|nr:hypothetical protein [Paraburkholderia saeva]CAG4895483.1 hypothetical protein R52603_01993 [Paraburkholderia saeva]
MSEVNPSNHAVAKGSYNTQTTHAIKSAILEAAIKDFESVASLFATNAILDNAVRQQYVKHIRMLSDQVRDEVANDNMTVKEGAEYCSGLRDKIFVEYRKYTSALGMAQAEKLKLQARGFDYYLNKYSHELYQKDFINLNLEERNAVYYKVLSKAGQGSVKVTTKVRRLQIGARVAVLVTAILATGEIIGAKDKLKEVARQGSIIAGGMIGGVVAGLGVSFVCGPAEPLCAAAVVLIGSNAGGMAAEAANDTYQEELPVFIDWMNN